MGEQCRATAKRTGRRCLQVVGPGAVVCRVHGGRAPQAQRKAVERALIAEALANRRSIDPRDVMADAVNSIYAVKQAITEQIAAGNPSPAFDLDKLSEALDRCVKYAQVALGAGVEERRLRLAERMGAEIAALIRAFADRLSLTPEQRALVPAALTAAVAEIGMADSDRRVIAA